MNDTPARRPRHLTLLLAGAVGLGSYLLGSHKGAEKAAFADGPGGQVVVADKEIFPISITPPAIAVEKGGWALVGAADGRYYIVCEDGRTVDIWPERRHNLFWR